MCIVYQRNLQTDQKIIQDLISMQSLTLAVTGISVAVVSIVVALISVYREKKIEATMKKINNLKKDLLHIKNDSREKQEKLNENLKKMINLLALQASEFSEQYFDNILSCIDSIEVEELEDTIKTQMSFVMVNTIEKIYGVSSWETRFKNNDMVNKEAYEKIIKYSNYMLQDKDLNKELRDFAILKYSFYLYELARLEERTEVEKAKKHLNEAYARIGELQQMKDTNGYVHYLCGVICLWLGKIDITLVFSEKYLVRFEEALQFLEKALASNQNFMFLNHKAVTIINIAYIYTRQGNKGLAIDNLNVAKNVLKKAMQYTKKYHLPYNNLANINRNLLEIKIGISNFNEEYRSICFDGLDDMEIGEIKNYIDDAIGLLQQSIEIEPNFIDSYYNSAVFYFYKYLLGKRKNEEDIKNAKEMLKKAESINPQSRKMLDIKGVVYEMS